MLNKAQSERLCAAYPELHFLSTAHCCLGYPDLYLGLDSSSETQAPLPFMGRSPGFLRRGAPSLPAESPEAGRLPTLGSNTLLPVNSEALHWSLPWQMSVQPSTALPEGLKCINKSPLLALIPDPRSQPPVTHLQPLETRLFPGCYPHSNPLLPPHSQQVFTLR